MEGSRIEVLVVKLEHTLRMKPRRMIRLRKPSTMRKTAITTMPPKDRSGSHITTRRMKTTMQSGI